MTQKTKFLFDYDFDEHELKELDMLKSSPRKDTKVEKEPEKEPEIVVPTFSEEQLALAKEQAFAEGKTEGLKEAQANSENKVPALLQKINAEMARVFKQQEVLNKSTRDSAIQVAISIARKCFPALSVNTGLDQVRQMVTDILPQVIDEPRVFIQIHPDMLVHLNEHLSKMVEDAHFDGKIILKGIDTFGVSDCKIEWANGGADRNVENIWRKIDDIIERNFGQNYSDFVPELPDLREGSEEEEEAPSSTETTTTGENTDQNQETSGKEPPDIAKASVASEPKPEIEPKIEPEINVAPEQQTEIEAAPVTKIDPETEEPEQIPEVDIKPDQNAKNEQQIPEKPLD